MSFASSSGIVVMDAEYVGTKSFKDCERGYGEEGSVG